MPIQKKLKMNHREVTVSIDSQKCTGCGSCVTVCSSGTISLINGIAQVTGESSLNCGHCMAICPESAITVGAIEPQSICFDTFELDHKYLAPGVSGIQELARIIASRRSCRKYLSKPVEVSLLKDLIKLGKLAPSGSNCQNWTFTVLSSRQEVVQCAKMVGEIYEKINIMAEKRFLRTLLKLVGKPELDNYYVNYYPKVKNAINEMKINGRDLLFHGATAAIIVGSQGESSSPKEDALLATQNILLAAHAMGLGTCLIGFAVKAFERDETAQVRLGIPEQEKIHAVIGLGYPNEKYRTITGRKKSETRYP